MPLFCSNDLVVSVALVHNHSNNVFAITPTPIRKKNGYACIVTCLSLFSAQYTNPPTKGYHNIIKYFLFFVVVVFSFVPLKVRHGTSLQVIATW